MTTVNITKEEAKLINHIINNLEIFTTDETYTAMIDFEITQGNEDFRERMMNLKEKLMRLTNE